MKKKRVIALSIVLGIIVVAIIFCCTVFRLNRIDIEFISQTEASFDVTKQQILDAGNFKMGSNLLFTKYDENIANIEKQCANLKVVKIVKKFPNKMSVYVREREGQLRIKDNEGYYYIFDEEMKVINITATYDDYKDYCECDFEGFELPNDLQLGDFLTSGEVKDKMLGLVNSIYSAGRTPMSIMSNILFEYDAAVRDYVYTFNFKTGAKVRITGEQNVSERAFNGMVSYNSVSQIYSAEELLRLKIDVKLNGQCVIKLSEDW